MSFLKNIIQFFQQKEQDKKNGLKYNIIFMLLLLCMIFAGDIFLVMIKRNSILIDSIVSMIMLFLSVFSLSFCSKYTKIIVATIIIIPLAISLNYTTYFENPIRPDDVIEAFYARSQSDIVDCFSYVWFIEPFIIVPYIMVICFSIFYDKKMRHCRFFTLIIPIVLCIIFVSAYKGDKFFYATPLKGRASIFNCFKTFPWVIIHYNDHIVENNYNILPSKIQQPYKITKIQSKKLPRVVFLIWGESTNADYLSLYGKSRFINDFKSTPKLEKIASKEKHKFTILKAISGGCNTVGSTALFFNLLNEPTNKKSKQDLFALAKKNGYKTYLLSAQETCLFEEKIVRNIDQIVSKDTHIALPRSYKDDYLLKQIKKLDLSKGKHFIVIQFRSVHEQYHANYARHKEYKHFKKNSKDDRKTASRKTYINNVLYLDYLLSEVINFAKKNNADYIIHTSDHGEFIGTNINGDEDGNFFGHCRLGFGDMTVPFMFYQKNPDKALQAELKKKKIITHSEISLLVAKILGFDVKRQSDEKDMFFMYASCVGTVNCEIMKVKRENGKFKQIYKGSAIEYLKKKYNF